MVESPFNKVIPTEEVLYKKVLCKFYISSISYLNLVVPIQVFVCEYCEIFKKNYFEEHPRTAASKCRLQQQ